MDNRMKKRNTPTIGDYPIDARPNIKLFDRFDWAAIGIAACGVIFILNIIWGI